MRAQTQIGFVLDDGLMEQLFTNLAAQQLFVENDGANLGTLVVVNWNLHFLPTRTSSRTHCRRKHVHDSSQNKKADAEGTCG
jgi:hypothetical protein